MNFPRQLTHGNASNVRLDSDNNYQHPFLAVYSAGRYNAILDPEPHHLKGKD